MSKQNELILTESALEDFKIFKMYMEKKNLFFISLPICCFQKTAALCGFSQVVDYQQIRTSIQSFISSFMNYSRPATTNDKFHAAHLMSYRPEWTCRGFVLVCVHKCDNWQRFMRVCVCLTFV